MTSIERFNDVKFQTLSFKTPIRFTSTSFNEAITNKRNLHGSEYTVLRTLYVYAEYADI